MSDRYERCAHNEQPSKCIYCLRAERDALRQRVCEQAREIDDLAEKYESLERATLEAAVMIHKLRQRLAEAEALLRRVSGKMPDRCAEMLMVDVDNFLAADSATHRENANDG